MIGVIEAGKSEMTETKIDKMLVNTLNESVTATKAIFTTYSITG